MSRKVAAVFEKQVKDTLKNKIILVQFVMYPILAVIMQNAIQLEDLPKNYFVILFATMYIGIAPLTSIASIISEEKENNTLRVLFMANVRGREYLLGVGAYIFLICMLGGSVFAFAGRYKGFEFGLFMCIMALGILISIVVGAVIGIFSKNQMAATSIAVIVMALIAFLPMIAMFNETIAKVSKFTYSQQLNNMMNHIGELSIGFHNIGMIGVNLLVAISLFIIAYRRYGLM